MLKLFKLVSSDPITKAQEYVMKGNWNKALIEYKKIVGEDPLNVRHRQKLGDIYAKLNKNSEAIEEYAKVACWYANEGYIAKAIAINKLIIKLDPNNKEIKENLVSLYASRGMEFDN